MRRAPDTTREIDRLYRRYCRGETTNEETIELFQRLANTGRAWRFPQSVQRECCRLIVAGLVSYRHDAPIPPHAFEH